MGYVTTKDIPHGVLATLALVAIFAVPAPGQQVQQVPHSLASHAQPNLIDGSKHPEQISDTAAFRLWFIAVAEDNQTGPSDRQKSYFHSGGIGDANMAVAAQILNTFRQKYRALIDGYNAQATASPKDTQALKTFLTDRDALVENTLQQLKIMLEPKEVTNLTTHIQAEKARMMVPVEEK